VRSPSCLIHQQREDFRRLQRNRKLRFSSGKKPCKSFVRFGFGQLLGCGVRASWSHHVGPFRGVRTWFACSETVNGSWGAVCSRCYARGIVCQSITPVPPCP
jgi:hypothetical protein